MVPDLSGEKNISEIINKSTVEGNEDTYVVICRTETEQFNSYT